ncbi:TldD/PmbA family protein [candidate division KSB1 bacterium]
MNHTDIDRGLVENIIQRGMQNGGDFCETYSEYRIQSSITLEENKIKESKSRISSGIGIRVLKGEKIGYAYSDVLEKELLLRAADTAAYVAENKNGTSVNIGLPADKKAYSCPYTIPSNQKLNLKSELLFRVNDAARRVNESVYQVNCTYFDEFKRIEIFNSDGLWKIDEQSVMNLYAVCLAQKNNTRDIGRAFAGGRYPLSLFDIEKPEVLGEKAAKQAVSKLSAQPAPAGMLPVVIAKGWGGVLVHEAVGHGLESDFHRKKTSLYTDKMGQKVASDHVTIVDDGTIPNGRGTLNIDDEGTKTGRTVLIENGRLIGLMSDILNSRLMNIPQTGNGRRMSFREFPNPRMTNTFIEAGNARESDLIKGIKKGIYAKQLGGGQVDITTGNFVFEVGEGYLIENGKITYPIRGANLIGNGPEAMKLVRGVGSDLTIESGTGTCGKDGQNVYVGVGQPAIFISNMTIGGTSS